jgi:hypothetical protein
LHQCSRKHLELRPRNQFFTGTLYNHEKYIAPQVKVPADGKYPLATSKIPLGVIVEGDMLGKIVSLKFVDHDIMNEQKFPKME